MDADLRGHHEKRRLRDAMRRLIARTRQSEAIDGRAHAPRTRQPAVFTRRSDGIISRAIVSPVNGRVAPAGEVTSWHNLKRGWARFYELSKPRTFPWSRPLFRPGRCAARCRHSTRSITSTISRSIHSSSSPRRQIWPQQSSGSRQACKEASSSDCSARTGRRLVRKSLPSDHYLSEVEAHGIVQNDSFYAYQTNGVRARDWVGWRRSDLRIIERAVELLSPAGAWDPQDRAGGSCPTSGSRYTLRCALRKAAGDVAGVTPNNENEDPAAVSEVAYSILDRMGTRERLFGGPPLVVYNNRPGATAADVIALLGDVRDRIRAYLRERRKQ
jgi:hypothetical protein